jgi:hypothetical protein
MFYVEERKARHRIVVRKNSFLKLCGASVLLLLAILGCGPSKPVFIKSGASEKNLQRIAGAYAMAALKLKHPPKELADLLPFLEGGTDQLKASDTLRSPNDGEEYVIHYGVDALALAEQRKDPTVVLAYERKGKGGRRLVLRAPTMILKMTDDEFKKAPFPPGQQPQL